MNARAFRDLWARVQFWDLSKRPILLKVTTGILYEPFIQISTEKAVQSFSSRLGNIKLRLGNIELKENESGQNNKTPNLC